MIDYLDTPQTRKCLMHLKESDKALKHGGYSKISLPFQQSSTSHVKPQNHHNVWFNPSYSSGVITNVAKRFLQLLDLHFPPSNKFHKIFNRNNVKVKKKIMNGIQLPQG